MIFGQPWHAVLIGGLIILGLVVMVTVGLKKHIDYLKDRPTEWTIFGEQHFAKEGLELIYENRPDPKKTFRWGGRIRYVDFIPDARDPERGVGGRVKDINVPELLTVRTDRFWKGATIHEVGHYVWLQTFGNIGEPDAWNPTREFLAWVERLRTIIRTAEEEAIRESALYEDRTRLSR